MYNKEKQMLVEKFAQHLSRCGVFYEKSCHDMLIEGIGYEIEIEFYSFIGKEKVLLEVYEQIDKKKFIELAIAYYYGKNNIFVGLESCEANALRCELDKEKI